MARKCSHCGNMGHNSRTCTAYRGSSLGVLRLFGVKVEIPPSSVSMKKSFSVDCLPSSAASPTSSSFSSPSSTQSPSQVSIDENSDKAIGYLSDGLINRAQEKKKG